MGKLSKNNGWVGNRCQWFMLLLAFFSPIVLNAVKTVHLPKEIKVEENVFTETVVRNLSAEGIYKADQCTIIGDYIYMGQERPVEVVKISLNGKVVGRFGREGQGPGEFIWIGGIKPYMGNIAIIEANYGKMVICNEKLELLAEYKLKHLEYDFLVDRQGGFILFGDSSYETYFKEYSRKGKFLRSFGKKVSSLRQRQKNVLFDSVRFALYDVEDDGIWASFRNRYDLRYYKNGQLKTEIQAPKDFFKGEAQNFSGREVIIYWDRAVHLAKSDNDLYYFYSQGYKIFCDVFDIKNYHLKRRIKLKNFHDRISHHQGNTFYTLTHSRKGEDDVLLYRLDLKQ